MWLWPFHILVSVMTYSVFQSLSMNPTGIVLLAKFITAVHDIVSAKS